jgi:hypothetical protein
MPPERVKMPMAPTFCFLKVFCTPATTAPKTVVWRAVLAVLERASCGWKVGCWAAMAGEVGVDVFLEALGALSLSLSRRVVVRLAPTVLADSITLGRKRASCIIGRRRASCLGLRAASN